MLRVDLHRARPGMKLALPVQNPKQPTRVLLKVGYELKDETIGKLKEHRIRSIWVRYPSLQFLEKFISQETVETQGAVITQIATTFEALQRGSAAKLNYDAYTHSIENLIQHLVTNPQAAMFLGDIDNAEDELMRHSSAVTYLSLLLGLKLEGYMVRERRHVDPGRAKEVRSLGVGAMLHDVGVTMLDLDTRARHKETNDDSDPGWREHPAMGFRLVRGKVDPSAASVVLHHHQRYNGTGWAGREFAVLSERNIHVFARIAAVADQFDLIRSPTHLPQQPTVWALSAMLSDPTMHGFDPQVLAALIAVVPPYAPGTIVKLSDDRHAVVIDHNVDQPCRPVVQMIPPPSELGPDDVPQGQTIDLREQSKRLFVAEAEGHDVSEMNFVPPGIITTYQAAA